MPQFYYIFEAKSWKSEIIFGELFNIAIDLLFYTFFQDCFIRGIFPAEKKLYRWPLKQSLSLGSARNSL